MVFGGSSLHDRDCCRFCDAWACDRIGCLDVSSFAGWIVLLLLRVRVFVGNVFVIVLVMANGNRVDCCFDEVWCCGFGFRFCVLPGCYVSCLMVFSVSWNPLADADLENVIFVFCLVFWTSWACQLRISLTLLDTCSGWWPVI